LLKNFQICKHHPSFSRTGFNQRFHIAPFFPFSHEPMLSEVDVIQGQAIWQKNIILFTNNIFCATIVCL
jgi:hypothetical protein